MEASHHHQSPSPRQSYHMEAIFHAIYKREFSLRIGGELVDRDSDGWMADARKYFDNCGGSTGQGQARRRFLPPKRTFAVVTQHRLISIPDRTRWHEWRGRSTAVVTAAHRPSAWVMVVRGRTLQGRGVTASRRGDGRESAGGGVGWKEREEREAREKWKGRTVARVVGAKRERVGSSHADRNGPTEFYPTIREARRGSGPRPTAATARNARPASVFPPSLGKLVSLSKGRD